MLNFITTDLQLYKIFKRYSTLCESHFLGHIICMASMYYQTTVPVFQLKLEAHLLRQSYLDIALKFSFTTLILAVTFTYILLSKLKSNKIYKQV